MAGKMTTSSQIASGEFDQRLVEALLASEPSDEVIIEILELGGCPAIEPQLIDRLVSNSSSPETLCKLVVGYSTDQVDLRQRLRAIDALLGAKELSVEACMLLDHPVLLPALRVCLITALMERPLTVSSARAILRHARNSEEQIPAARYLLDAATSELGNDLRRAVLYDLIVWAPEPERQTAWQRWKALISPKELADWACRLIEDAPELAGLILDSLSDSSLLTPDHLVCIVCTTGVSPTVRANAYVMLAPHLDELHLDDLLAVSTAAKTTDEPRIISLVARAIREQWRLRPLAKIYASAERFPAFAVTLFTHLLATDASEVIYHLKQDEYPALHDWLEQRSDPEFTALFERRGLDRHGFTNLIQLFPGRLAALVAALHTEEAGGFTCLVGAYLTHRTDQNERLELVDQLKPLIDDRLTAGPFGPADARTLATMAYGKTEFADRAAMALQSLPVTGETLRYVARLYPAETLRSMVLQDPNLAAECLKWRTLDRERLLFPE
jgi:hypothetical protein